MVLLSGSLLLYKSSHDFWFYCRNKGTFKSSQSCQTNRVTRCSSRKKIQCREAGGIPGDLKGQQGASSWNASPAHQLVTVQVAEWPSVLKMLTTDMSILRAWRERSLGNLGAFPTQCSTHLSDLTPCKENLMGPSPHQDSNSGFPRPDMRLLNTGVLDQQSPGSALSSFSFHFSLSTENRITDLGNLKQVLCHWGTLPVPHWLPKQTSLTFRVSKEEVRWKMKCALLSPDHRFTIPYFFIQSSA